MWRVWMMFDPRRALVAVAVFLFTLAIFIHFVVLSTDRFNWIEGPSGANATTEFATEALVSATREDLSHISVV
ncbi:MAG: light-harvesting antenna LH1, alpha subunit [Pseudomonadota bacterium]